MIRYTSTAQTDVWFADAVRQEILREPPQLVAVELPVTLESAYGRAVQRLPELSIIIYDSDAGDEAVYVPVEPTDPFVEALRSARESAIPSTFLDPDLSDKPHVEDAYPDSYAVARVGLQKYVESFRMQPREADDTLLIHAEGAAWKLQGCDPLAEILVVVSLNLLDPLLEAMERPQAQPLRKSARRNVRALNLHPDSPAFGSAPIVQPVTFSIIPSSHHPSGVESDGTPLSAAFIPLVPDASKGGSGRLTHTSVPAVSRAQSSML
jgi:hypothetical protein